MDSMDNLCERFEALERLMEQLQHQTRAREAPTRMIERRRGWCLTRRVAAVIALGLALVPLPHAQAETFACGAGAVQCLIEAINEANTNGEDNTITLEAGTYTLTMSDNDTNGPNGLPSVTSTLTIRGAEAASTIITRESEAPQFRLMHIEAAGTLTMEGLTLQGGSAVFGSGIFNEGTLTLLQSTLADNGHYGVVEGVRGGGLYNAGGTVHIINSTLANNSAGERYGKAGGGGLYNAGGTVHIINSTLANNSHRCSGCYGGGGGGGIWNDEGTVILTNSTVAGNSSVLEGGGIFNQGTLTLASAIVANNSGGNCSGTITSHGDNLSSDATCVTTDPTLNDRNTTDPLLDPAGLQDNGGPTPTIALQPGSPALDAVLHNPCPPPATDQRGFLRPAHGENGTGARCDIGAFEFNALPPVVNSLVTFVPLPSTYQTTSEATGCHGGFVGTFRFTARLTAKPGSPALTDLRVEVQTLTNGNLLQNADGGPGGVGATLTVPQADAFVDGLLSPEEAVDVPFVVCLQERSPFRFLVDVLGIVSDEGE